MVLWHGQFFGLPAVEIGAVSVLLATGLVLGIMGSQSLHDGYVDYIPTRLATRIPFYVVQLISSVAMVSSFGVALVLTYGERKMLSHFVTQRELPVHAVLIWNFLRYSSSSSDCYVVAWPQGLIGEGFDTVLVNIALFSISASLSRLLFPYIMQLKCFC
jgi:hypothetical protein